MTNIYLFLFYINKYLLKYVFFNSTYLENLKDKKTILVTKIKKVQLQYLSNFNKNPKSLSGFSPFIEGF